jgi:hypothetical protein
MSFLNPISPIQVGGQSSVSRVSTFGTTFSNTVVGGFMQVNSLTDLIYTIPSGSNGLIEYSGNTIPIQFLKGDGNLWSPDVLTLNSDNQSSGRRKLGMLVYVREQDQIYQYTNDTFLTLWSAATAATNTVVISNFGTTVNNSTVAGQNFINSWTASTIDGYNGVVRANAVWKKYYGNTISLTGASFNSGTGTLTLTNITGGTQTLTGFGSGGGGGAGITGGTFNQNTLDLNLTSSAGTVTINGVTGLYISGGTFNSGTTTLSLFNSTGGTISVTGFTSGGGGGSSNLQYFITGSTPSGLTINSGDRWFDTNTGVEVVYINDGDSSQWVRPSNGMVPLFTGNTSATCITSLYVSNIYGCSPININDLVIANSGITTNGLTATTISATTYFNLPTDVRVTGSTYSNNTFTFTNNTGGTFSVLFNTVTGLTVNGGLSATTISATTYQNLPFSGTVRNSGTTTSNFIPKWTGTTALTNSQIQDNGINISIGQSPTSIYRFWIVDNNTGTTNSFVVNGGSVSSKTAIRSESNATQYGTGVYGSAVGSVESIGLDGLTLNGTLAIGVRGIASPDEFTNITTGIGGYFASDDSYGYGLPTNRYSVQLKDGTEGINKVLISTTSDGKANWSDTLTGLTNVRSTTISATTQTISGTKGSVVTSGSSTTAFITVSGSDTLGGASYVDFLRVTNNSVGATNATKTIRVNNTGGMEFLNSAYTAVTLTIGDNGILFLGGGGVATVSNNDATSNYLSFNLNNSQIYDDGNTHIHSRGAGQSMWINTNGGQLNLLSQSPTSTGSIGSGIAIATGSLIGYVTINTGKTYTTSASYGYLVNSATPTGQYPGGSQSVSISLYATARIWAQEFDAFSDERMKDIQGTVELDDAIKLVNDLKPIKYTWKEGEDKGLKVGYSAQQVSKAGFDHLIGVLPKEGLEETIDEDGFVSPKDTQFSMNYEQVTPYHGVVIKHLLEEIEKLKEEIKELKSKVG